MGAESRLRVTYVATEAQASKGAVTLGRDSVAASLSNQAFKRLPGLPVPDWTTAKILYLPQKPSLVLSLASQRSPWPPLLRVNTKHCAVAILLL